MGVGVYNHYRRQPACTQASNRFKGKASVFTGAALFNLVAVFDPHQRLLDPLHVTGGSHAKFDEVSPLGLHGKKGIKGSHAIYFAAGQIHSIADIVDELYR